MANRTPPAGRPPPKDRKLLQRADGYDYSIMAAPGKDKAE